MKTELCYLSVLPGSVVVAAAAAALAV